MGDTSIIYVMGSGINRLEIGLNFTDIVDSMRVMGTLVFQLSLIDLCIVMLVLVSCILFRNRHNMSLYFVVRGILNANFMMDLLFGFC